jgi:hypothetical protein
MTKSGSSASLDSCLLSDQMSYTYHFKFIIRVDWSTFGTIFIVFQIMINQWKRIILILKWNISSNLLYFTAEYLFFTNNTIFAACFLKRNFNYLLKLFKLDNLLSVEQGLLNACQQLHLRK